MPSSISSIKTRIKSINSTKKITGAMKSVSTVKLNRMSKATIKNREYKDVLEEIASYVLNAPHDFDSKYCKNNDSDNIFYIIFTSDVGLCGSYNASIIKYAENTIKSNDFMYLVGISSYSLLSKQVNNVVNEEVPSDNIEYRDLMEIFTEASIKFLNGEVKEVKVIYNKWINSMVYKTSEYQLLPFVKTTDDKAKEIILEPNPNEIFDSLLSLVLKNELYNLYLDSKTSEQVARRFAMENATNNAEDLISDLTLEYNKARQSSITQEITEIVSGANAT